MYFVNMCMREIEITSAWDEIDIIERVKQIIVTIIIVTVAEIIETLLPHILLDKNNLIGLDGD